MLYYAVVFLILALVSGFYGFSGISGGGAVLAQIGFAVFLIAFLIAAVIGLVRRGDKSGW